MELEKYIDDNVFSLTEEDIHHLNDLSHDGGINNVIRLVESECMGLHGFDSNEYELFYITNIPKLRGLLLKLNNDNEHHNSITLAFSKVVADTHHECNLNFLDIANTFQHKKKAYFSKVGDYIVIDSTDIVNRFGENATCAFLHKPIDIPYFDKLSFYKEVFEYVDIQKVHDDTSKANKIYILYDQRNNLFKIGRSIHAQQRERTLQGENPKIDMLACWIAPKEVEKELHTKYAGYRKRGEWFSLNYHHLNEIDEYMTIYR